MILLPQPRRLLERPGFFPLPEEACLRIDSALLPVLQAGLDAFFSRAGLRWPAASEGPAALSIDLQPELMPHPQGYRLSIQPEDIQLRACDPAGAFYGLATLAQIAQQSGPQGLPALDVIDWPDFPNRGVLLDVSRDRVPRMDTLFALVDRLASWKVNQLQLYFEHTFQYEAHPDVWQQASPFTPEEVRALDRFCRERFIELVPNQNSFGHMERWLKHARYGHLAETFEPFVTPWGMMDGPFSLQPEHPGSLELISGLYDELLPNFSSRQVNVGGDEALDVGQGASRDLVARDGLGQVYLRYLLKLHEQVRARGRVMQYWGDIASVHPEMIEQLPRDAVAMVWGYEADCKFEEPAARLVAAGLPFMVCPGTSSWLSLSGRTENALGNIRAAAEVGLRYGALGLLTTDWGDRGHWQQLPVSFLGLTAGAAAGWCLETFSEDALAGQLDRFAFEDEAGLMGRLAIDLGNAYRLADFQPPNSSVLFWLLQWPLSELEIYRALLPPAEKLSAARGLLDQYAPRLEQARMQRPDAALIRREYALTIGLLRHALGRAELLSGSNPQEMRARLANELAGLLEEYRALWLARSRPGGLDDSLARFDHCREEYRAAPAVQVSPDAAG